MKVVCTHVWLLTFHASHVSAPGPVLPRCHGGNIVFWVCMHGLTHEGAIHVDRIITAKKTPVFYDTKLNSRLNELSLSILLCS